MTQFNLKKEKKRQLVKLIIDYLTKNYKPKNIYFFNIYYNNINF